MNEQALLHIPDSRYCFAADTSHVVLRLRTMRGEEIRRLSVLYGCKYEFADNRRTAVMERKYRDRLFDYYEAAFSLEDVRLAYVFYLETEQGNYYFSEDGLTKEYCFELGYYNFFQLPYIHAEDTIETVEWMRSAVFYQIFVDRFRRGDEKKADGYINLPWGEKPESKSFAGGDLQGILEKLDYIKGLGVNAIYLTPIFPSVSNHKYDIYDYGNVDTQFGDKETLKELVETAHRKGMRIILDAVFNHCSSKLPQFQDVLEKGKASPYHDWFHIQGERPEPEKGNYECFSSCEYMPKFNTGNSGVRKYLLDIACYWIREFDIDGWRLDVSDEISHDFWRQFRRAVKCVKSDCVIIGENWHDAYPFLQGDQYDSIMNYAFTKACLDYFAFGAFGAEELANKLNELLMRNKGTVNDMMMNLLDSHDTHRFYSQVGKDRDKVLAAVAIETCFPGAPCIYYGTEICLEGGYDPDSRRTFDWEKSHWDLEFGKTFRQILTLKKEKALGFGEVSISSAGQVFRMERAYGGEQLVLLHNGGKDAVNLTDMNSAHSHVLVSNLMKGEKLLSGGFAVLRIERC